MSHPRPHPLLPTRSTLQVVPGVLPPLAFGPRKVTGASPSADCGLPCGPVLSPSHPCGNTALASLASPRPHHFRVPSLLSPGPCLNKILGRWPRSMCPCLDWKPKSLHDGSLSLPAALDSAPGTPGSVCSPPLPPASPHPRLSPTPTLKALPGISGVETRVFFRASTNRKVAKN